MSQLAVAVIGLGNAGHSLHLPALAGIRSARVVGAVDPDASRRSRAAESWKVPVFDDFDRMIAIARPDVVIVGTPPHTHADYCMRSFDAKAHVLCEKPFVTNLDEADRVLAAAAAAGKRLALNHTFREMPVFRAVLDAVNNTAAASEPVFAQVWQNMDLPPWKEPGWRGAMLQHVLFEAGIHLVDFLIALFGEKPRSVTASVSTCGVRDDDTDAIALVTLEFSRGRLAQLIQNRLCKGETQFFEVRAETSAASFRASFGGRARISAGLLRDTKPHLRVEYGVAGLAWREVGNQRTIIARNPKNAAMIGTRLLFEKTFAAFRNGMRPPASGQDGRDVLEVLAACYHSAASGRRVELSGPEARELAGMTMGAPAE